MNSQPFPASPDPEPPGVLGAPGAPGVPGGLAAGGRLGWRARILCGGMVAFLYVLDQATKLWTVRNLELGEHRVVGVGWFDWVHFSNTGAAFGILQDSNRFFMGLSLVALGGIGWALWRGVFPGWGNRVALLWLLAGVLGNLTDRLLHGYVVDFLLFDLGFVPANPWPAFNVADSCICGAVALLLWGSLREEWGRGRRKA
ncbi:MAG: signal peptidase [Verrucomicrobiota bacterium]|jgi:signal peptidase II